MTSRRLGILVAATVLVITTGCSDDGDPGDPPGDSSSPPAEPSSEPTSESTSEPTEPSSEPTEPVEGTRYELEGLSFVVPEPYRARQEGDFVLARIGPDDPVASITVTAVPSIGTLSFDELIEIHEGSHFYETGPERLEPVTIDGVSMFHLAGRTNDITWVEVFGTDEPGYTIDIALEFRFTRSATQRQQVVDDFLASIELAG